MAETVTIAELGAGGDGIAEIDGRRVFVPFTLPSDDVSIELTQARGRVVEILRPSPDRVAPACRHFGTCGGCALQHMEASAYHAWKRAVVEKSLALHGIAAPVEPIVPIVPASRRRAVLSAMKTAKGTVMGFHRRGANEIVPIEECPVLETAIVSRLPLLRRIAEIAARPKRRARLTVVRADNGLDIALDGGGRVDRTVLERLGALGVEQDNARLSVNGTMIFVNRRPEIATSGGALFPPPGGFVQAAATAEARLAREVLRQVGDAGPVADLFAGIGTFTLPLAKRSPVTAMEGDKDLLKALEDSIRHARGLKPVTTRRRDLFVNPPAPVELNTFQGVVFDPPAAGARALSESLAASSVPKVVAVSCNPATLARDARILIDGGYRLTRVQPVDQFLWSPEIEVVAAFER